MRERLQANLPMAPHERCWEERCEGCKEQQMFNYVFRDGD